MKQTEKGDGYLEQFDLRHYLNKATTGTEPDESTQSESNAKRGAKAVKARASIKTEILFIERVWSLDDSPAEETVTSHIRGLRHKLKSLGAPEDFIETVHGLGYRLK